MNNPEQSRGGELKAGAEAVIGHHPPWRAKSVWLAALLAVVGAVFWFKDAGQRPVQPSSATGLGKSEFAGAPNAAGGQEQQVSAKAKLPATLRLGVSYVVGFFLGWSLRRFVTLTLVVSGAIFALILVAQKLGWMDVDWAGIEGHVRSGVSSVKSEATTVKNFVTGFLPSAAGAGLGVFFGFRRK
jgi:uncharacterized membrane protein (Fun14 family)